jgi:hypothetical protein
MDEIGPLPAQQHPHLAVDRPVPNRIERECQLRDVLDGIVLSRVAQDVMPASF